MLRFDITPSLTDAGKDTFEEPRRHAMPVDAIVIR